MEINNTNDKLALIQLAEYVVMKSKESKSNEEIYHFLKDSFGFSDELIEQIM